MCVYKRTCQFICEMIENIEVPQQYIDISKVFQYQVKQSVLLFWHSILKRRSLEIN